jgi:monoamine oxidase
MNIITNDRVFDVIVVGAGFAGLAAAVDLRRQGYDVLLIEASGRLGGRTWTVPGDDGRPLERGGQLFNGDMTKLLSRIRQAGLSVSSVAMGGAIGGYANGALRYVSPLDPFGFLAGLAPCDVAGKTLGDIIRAAGLDQVDERLATSAACELLGTDPDDIHAAALIRHGYHYHSERTEAEFQIREGMSALAVAMAAELVKPPIMSSPVRAISVREGLVYVKDDQAVWTGRSCILAMTPPAARRISMTPAWPLAIKQALGSFKPGAVIKTTLSYALPFWRLHGWNGAVQFAEPLGLSVIDGSRDDGADRLIMFLGGHEAVKLAKKPADERRDYLISFLVSAFGPVAAAVTHYDQAIWIDDPWCGGGYVAKVAQGGVEDSAEQLRELDGLIVFACSEIADHFPGFVEGAIASGETAAVKISARLRSHRN